MTECPSRLATYDPGYGFTCDLCGYKDAEWWQESCHGVFLPMESIVAWTIPAHDVPEFVSSA